MIITFLFCVTLIIIALILTLNIGKNPHDENYHAEKGKNMMRLIWIYSALFIFFLVVAIAFLFY